MLGFSFNGVHSSDFGIVMRSKNRPILPEPKTVTEEVPYRNGVYDFSAVNPYGHTVYKQREITVDCSFISKNAADLRKRAREIAIWLSCGEAELVFDDESNVYYLAAVANHIDFEQQIAKIGSFTVMFSCRPLALSFAVSGEVPSYGGGYGYDGFASYGGCNIFNVAGGTSLNVVNFGTYVRPKIVLEGSFKNVTVRLGEKFINYPESSSGNLIFDCEKMKAVLNGGNVNGKITGSFFELLHGSNEVNIVADEINCVVKFVFNYLFL